MAVISMVNADPALGQDLVLVSGSAFANEQFYLYDLAMTRYLAMVSLLVAVLAGPPQAVAAAARLADESPILMPAVQSWFPGRSMNDVISPSSAAGPMFSPPSKILREIPSISGRYSVGGRTILPYLGAGFGGGRTSDFNRFLSDPPSLQPDAGLRSQLGQELSPNEFQMGLRIPF